MTNAVLSRAFRIPTTIFNKQILEGDTIVISFARLV